MHGSPPDDDAVNQVGQNNKLSIMEEQITPNGIPVSSGENLHGSPQRNQTTLNDSFESPKSVTVLNPQDNNRHGVVPAIKMDGKQPLEDKIKELQNDQDLKDCMV